MKKARFTVFLLLIVVAFTACNRQSRQLETPENIRITVVGRVLTVTWDEVRNASGYIINTSSIGCASGNRITNTSTGIVTTPQRERLASTTASRAVTDRGNGFVTITGATSIAIWLMPAVGSETEAMASTIIANVTAVGNGRRYQDSRPSVPVALARENFLP